MAFNSIVNDYNTFWDNKFKSLKMDSTVFKNFKQISSYKKRSEIPAKLIDSDSNTIESDLDKANAFAKQFEQVHSLTVDTGNQQVESFISNNFSTGNILDFNAINQKEAADAIECVVLFCFANIKEPGVYYYGFWAGKAENDNNFSKKLCLAKGVWVQSWKNVFT